MNRLVSIIIPVYKTGIYIERAVESIQRQTYKNVEMLLVDDGSPDDSGKICDSIASKDARIRVIHKQNGGLSDARNVAINEAKGDLIMYMDSDDFWADIPNALADIIGRMNEKWDICDFLIFNYVHYYQKDNIYKNNYSYAKLEGIPKTSKLLAFSRMGHFPMAAWSKIIKKDFLIKNKINFIKGICSEDIPWFIDLLENCNDFDVVNTYLYIYRKQVPGAITSKFSYKKFDDLLYIIENSIHKIETKNYDKELKYFILSFMAYEYSILIAQFIHIDKDREKKYKNWMQKYSWLLKYTTSKKTRAVRVCISVLGIQLTSHILNFYIRKFVNKSL